MNIPNIVSGILATVISSFFTYKIMYLLVTQLPNMGRVTTRIIVLGVPAVLLIVGTLALYVLFQYIAAHLGYQDGQMTAKAAGILLIIAGVLYAIIPIIHASAKNAEAATWLLLFTVPAGLVGVVIGVVTTIIGFLKK